MKFFLLLFVTSFLSVAGKAQLQTPFVEVGGVAKYTKEVSLYRARIELSPSGYYSYNADGKPSLGELRKDFFAKMKENNLEQKRFKKDEESDPYGASAYNQEKERYVFETVSEEEFKSFLKIRKINGSQLVETKVIYKPLTDSEPIIVAAVKDAQKSAAIIAKAVGKKLGDVLSVTDYNSSDRWESDEEAYYPSKNTQTRIRISVRYSMVN